MKLNIFDFDLTITKQHTFHRHQRAANQDAISCIKMGFHDAKSQKKDGIEQFIRIDDAHTTAIITHHNNPDYIAGFVGAILNKSRVSKKNLELQKPGIAACSYRFDGVKNPLVICHIATTGEDYNCTWNQLYGKSEMLDFALPLIQSELGKQLITSIRFYDDDLKNVISTLEHAYVSHDGLELYLNIKQNAVKESLIRFTPCWVNPFSDDFQANVITKHITDQILPLEMCREKAERYIDEYPSHGVIRPSSIKGELAITLRNDSLSHYLLSNVINNWLLLTAKSRQTINIDINETLFDKFIEHLHNKFDWLDEICFKKKEPLQQPVLPRIEQQPILPRIEQQPVLPRRPTSIFQALAAHEEGKECDLDDEKPHSYRQ